MLLSRDRKSRWAPNFPSHFSVHRPGLKSRKVTVAMLSVTSVLRKGQYPTIKYTYSQDDHTCVCKLEGGSRRQSVKLPPPPQPSLGLNSRFLVLQVRFKTGDRFTLTIRLRDDTTSFNFAYSTGLRRPTSDRPSSSQMSALLNLDIPANIWVLAIFDLQLMANQHWRPGAFQTLESIEITPICTIGKIFVQDAPPILDDDGRPSTIHKDYAFPPGITFATVIFPVSEADEPRPPPKPPTAKSEKDGAKPPAKPPTAVSRRNDTDEPRPAVKTTTIYFPQGDVAGPKCPAAAKKPRAVVFRKSDAEDGKPAGKQMAVVIGQDGEKKPKVVRKSGLPRPPPPSRGAAPKRKPQTANTKKDAKPPKPKPNADTAPQEPEEDSSDDGAFDGVPPCVEDLKPSVEAEPAEEEELELVYIQPLDLYYCPGNQMYYQVDE